VLFEGGALVLGSLLDQRQIDEVHVFVAPKLVGGGDAVGPVAGRGVDRLTDALELADATFTQVGPDVYIQGRTRVPLATSGGVA
jgi:diaminohydroxyphosphoribosylaminopyrimidine deaminase/5-amino-6-(5-phosphoribosylamino)uracil reductase